MSGSRLRDNFVILCQKLDVEKVIPYLCEERMLTADEHEQLSLPMLSVRNKRERLLLLLPRKGRRHFESFGNCLVWSGQVDLARAIGIDVDSVPPSPYGSPPQAEPQVPIDQIQLFQLFQALSTPNKDVSHSLLAGLPSTHMPQPGPNSLPGRYFVGSGAPHRKHPSFAGGQGAVAPLPGSMYPHNVPSQPPPVGGRSLQQPLPHPLQQPLPRPQGTYPQVFVLYCKDDKVEGKSPEDFCSDVMDLADILSHTGGLKCHFDGYDMPAEQQPTNWSLWTENMIIESDFVLMVCSPSLLQLLQSQGPVEMLKGKFYANAITNAIPANAQKFIPVFLNVGLQLEWIPTSLLMRTCYQLNVAEFYEHLGDTEGLSHEEFGSRLGEVLQNQRFQQIASLLAHLRGESYNPQPLAPLNPVRLAAQPIAPGLCPTDEEAAKKLFDEAMEKGYVESRAIVLLLIGAAGAGKSHFKHLILRLPPPAVRESTPLAEAAIRSISICRATIGDEDMEWQVVSSQESLRMVADAIKAGVPVRLFPLAHFSVHVLPLDPTPIKNRSSSQPSSNAQHSVPLAEKAPVPPLDTSPTSPSSISSTLESLDLSEPSQLTLEKELVDLISQSSGSRKLLEVDWVYIVDSGGQPQFHEILPAFIHYASACVFVTRLDESLTEHPTIEFYGQGGQPHGIPYRSLLTHEQILQHCFQALQSRRCTSSSPQSGPMVFVAGTHKDLEHHCPETRDAKNKKLLESLRPVFGDKLGLYRLAKPDQLIFPVNAKTPSREDEKVASEFRKMVTTSCPYEREKIPIPWFVLEQLIHQYATEKGVSIVSTKECRRIAGRLHMGEEAFHAALDYLVALNIFHYYPTILPDVVFCDTQVLPDKMSELVEYSHMLRGSCSSSSSVSGMQSHSGGWLRFRDEGIITVEFLQEFPKHYVAGLFTPSDLLKLLTALLITAHLAGSEYFMPSLLYELQPDELDHYRCSLTSSPSPLLVHYPGGWLPSGIYTSLIAYLQNVSSWKLLLKSGKPDCLHRNCVKFRHPGGRPGSITLIDSFTHFEVHLVTPKPVSPSLCCEIHRAIFDGLKQAVDTLSYTNVHPKEAFFCSARGEVCGPTPHLAVVGVDHQWWSCSLNPEVGGELTEGQTLWFSSAEDRAQEKEHAEELKSPKPTQKPHPQPLPKPRQSEATDPDPTERVPSSADKPKLYQLQCLQCRWRRVKIIETVAAKWEEVALALHFEGHTIQNIRYDPHIQCIDTACRVMLQKWLDGEGRQPVAWGTLMDALIDIGFVTVVEDLQEILRN